MNTINYFTKYLSLSGLIFTLFTFNAWAIPSDAGPYKVGFSQVSFIDTTRDTNQINKPGEPNGRRVDIALYYPIGDDVATTGINMIYTISSENLPIQLRSFVALKSVYDAKVGVASILPNFPSDPNVSCFNTAVFNCTDSVISPLPVSNKGPFPLIMYAHGSPGSGTMASVNDQAEFFASHGFIVAAPSFMGNRFQDSAAGSCTAKPGGQRPCSGLKTADRANDLSFALNKLLEKNNTANDLLHNRIDTNHIGSYGYSAGVGGVIPLIAGGNFSDGSIAIKHPLIKAAAYGALGVASFANGQINPLNITIPVMALAGTADPRAADLQLSYERISATSTQEKYLLLIKNMHHLGTSNSFCNLLSDIYFKSYPLGNMTNFDMSLIRLLFGFDATLPNKGGIQSICPSELFYDPINLSIITTMGLSPRLLPAEQIPGQFINGIYTPTMLASEGQRITNKYLLAFFKAKLQNDMASKRILVPGNVKGQEPEVLLKVCEAVGVATKCHSNMEEGNTLINPIADMNGADE